MLPKVVTSILLVSLLLLILAPIQAFSTTFASSGPVSVSSYGTNQSMMLMEVVPYSSTYHTGQPISAYTISGAMPECLKPSTSSYCQEWFQIFIDPDSGYMFPVNQTNVKAEVSISQKSPTIYYDISLPGTTTTFGTVGQDTDTPNGTLSEWQWIDPNHVNSGSRPNPAASTSGSFNGGGPAGCSTNSGGSYHISDYTVVTDQDTGLQVRVMGIELITSQFGSSYSLTALVFVNVNDQFNAFANDLHGTNVFNCGEVMAPSISPQLRWFVREPPVAGAPGSFSIHGNFGVIPTQGASLLSTTTDQLFQGVNIYGVSGFMPAQICNMCVLAPFSIAGGATPPIHVPTANIIHLQYLTIQ